MTDTPPPRVLLTGRPGVGKTTALRRALALLEPEGCFGFYTEEVREHGRRVGFDVVTTDGRRAPLARLGAPGPRVGRYGVDVPAFDTLAVELLEQQYAGAGRLLLIDEIGKMELFSERFVLVIRRIFGPRGRLPVLGTIMRGHHPVAYTLRRQPGVKILQVTLANRDELPLRLSRLFAR